MSVAIIAPSTSPHMHSATFARSPMDSKKVVIKSEDSSPRIPSSQSGEKTTEPHSDPAHTIKESSNHPEKKQPEGASNEATQPLAPPPRPAQTQQNGNDLDYFSTSHNNSHFSREPNPFEQSFGNPSTEQPGSKSLLPPVAALTSPAPLGGEGASASGYGWGGSLRSGPLSPAMLGGPVGAGATDYFDSSLRGTTFPSGVTPNESSLRTGLTPGGGGSMFPAPSPNSQALYQQLASGGATPSTLDFHRTAMNAAAIRKGSQYNGITSQSESKAANTAVMDPAIQPQPQQPSFGQHDNDAANGLFLLAQASNGSQQSSHYPVPSTTTAPNNQGTSQETSPTMAQVAARNGSLTGSAQGSGDISDSADQVKPATRSRGKRSSGGKNAAASNGRRKAEEAPAKQPSAKKAKNNASVAMDMNGMDSDEEQVDIKEEQYHGDGRKMTDEEKRKNFLERNRVAALKCRQRKKQWLANLQAKVEIFSSENDSLSSQVASLREEIVTLKSILIQHKDCPVSQSQGLGAFFQQDQPFNPHANPYGMGIQNGQQVMAGQRR